MIIGMQALNSHIAQIFFARLNPSLALLKYILTIKLFPSLNLSMFNEKDGTTINNEDRKEF